MTIKEAIGTIIPDEACVAIMKPNWEGGRTGLLWRVGISTQAQSGMCFGMKMITKKMNFILVSIWLKEMNRRRPLRMLVAYLPMKSNSLTSLDTSKHYYALLLAYVVLNESESEE